MSHLNKKIAILGGGISGIFLSYSLQKLGFTDITIYEKDTTLGGLAGVYKFDEFSVEKYYHHIFNNDTYILELIHELGLEKEILFKESKIGNLQDGKIYPFVGALDLLRYPFLGFIDKIRIGFWSVFLQKWPLGDRLKNLSVQSWIIKRMGLSAWNKLWQPIFKRKFHQFTEGVSLAFLWSRLYTRANSKKNGKEMLGYMRGGFFVIIEKIIEILDNKINIKYNSCIEKVTEKSVRVNGENFDFDVIISTLPIPIFKELIDKEKYPDYFHSLNTVNYLSVICPLFIFSKPLTEYYWINNLSTDADFSGIIEHTNLFDFSEYQSKKLVYISNYLSPENNLMQKDDEYLKKYYIDSLQKSLRNEIIPEEIYISRNRFAQPVYDVNFSESLTAFTTPISQVYQFTMVNLLPLERGLNNTYMKSIELSRQLLQDV